MYKYRKIANSLAPELAEVGCRVDWLGRIYTVVNIKEEFREQILDVDDSLKLPF